MCFICERVAYKYLDGRRVSSTPTNVGRFQRQQRSMTHAHRLLSSKTNTNVQMVDRVANQV